MLVSLCVLFVWPCVCMLASMCRKKIQTSCTLTKKTPTHLETTVSTIMGSRLSSSKIRWESFTEQPTPSTIERWLHEIYTLYTPNKEVDRLTYLRLFVMIGRAGRFFRRHPALWYHYLHARPEILFRVVWVAECVFGMLFLRSLNLHFRSVDGYLVLFASVWNSQELDDNKQAGPCMPVLFGARDINVFCRLSLVYVYTTMFRSIRFMPASTRLEDEDVYSWVYQAHIRYQHFPILTFFAKKFMAWHFQTLTQHLQKHVPKDVAEQVILPYVAARASKLSIMPHHDPQIDAPITLRALPSFELHALPSTEPPLFMHLHKWGSRRMFARLMHRKDGSIVHSLQTGLKYPGISYIHSNSHHNTMPFFGATQKVSAMQEVSANTTIESGISSVWVQQFITNKQDTYFYAWLLYEPLGAPRPEMEVIECK